MSCLPFLTAHFRLFNTNLVIGKHIGIHFIQPFDEFKLKHQSMLRVVQAILKNDDHVAQLLNSLEQEDCPQIVKQRQASNGTETYKNLPNTQSNYDKNQ